VGGAKGAGKQACRIDRGISVKLLKRESREDARDSQPPCRRLPWLRSISFYANGSFVMPRDRDDSTKRDETIPRRCLAIPASPRVTVQSLATNSTSMPVPRTSSLVLLLLLLLLLPVYVARGNFSYIRNVAYSQGIARTSVFTSNT